MLAAIAEAQGLGARLEAACAEAGLSKRTIERWRSRPEGDDRRCGPRHRPKNALTLLEEAEAMAVMTSAEFRDVSPKQLVPRLADRNVYLASESTLYRLQHRFGIRQRRRVASRAHVTRASAVHRATGPNQVWSWDITWLPTLVRGRYFYLYLVMDVWSRRIVGWEIFDRESPDEAAALIQRICVETGVNPHGLVLHSDNGKPMRGATMIATLQWLGVVPSFSRPHVSNDNPYSEALFRTLKHTPTYPKLPFADTVAARRWVSRFVAWYNGEHRHSGIRYVTPDERHTRRDAAILANRHSLYERARLLRPERWSRGTRNWSQIGVVTLNPQPQQLTAA